VGGREGGGGGGGGVGGGGGGGVIEGLRGRVEEEDGGGVREGGGVHRTREDIIFARLTKAVTPLRAFQQREATLSTCFLTLNCTPKHTPRLQSGVISG